MKNTKQTTMLSWLIGAPLRFSVLTTIFTLFLTVLYGTMAKNISALRFINPIDVFLIIGFISVVCSSIFCARKLNTKTLDRKTFVAISNAQTMLATAIIFFSSLLMSLSPSVLLTLQSIAAQGLSPSLLLATITMSIFFMYTIGLFMCCAYAKIRRAQTMGIPTWKIIFSIPFGFSMTWIPGYFIDSPKSKDTIEIKTKWYNQLTTKILSKPVATALAFCTITVASGVFFGFSSVLLTFASAMIFSICTMRTKPNEFAKHIGGTYSTLAVVINIVFIISLGISFTTAVRNMPSPAPMEITISETNL